MMIKNLWNKYFNKEKYIDRTKTTIVHDMESNCWGNAIQWLEWKDRRVYGHMYGITNGDVFISNLSNGKKGLFRLINIRYQDDPRDMFFADVEDIGFWEDFPEYKFEERKVGEVRFLI